VAKPKVRVTSIEPTWHETQTNGCREAVIVLHGGTYDAPTKVRIVCDTSALVDLSWAINEALTAMEKTVREARTGITNAANYAA
jgi:hypothetical protein